MGGKAKWRALVLDTAALPVKPLKGKPFFGCLVVSQRQGLPCREAVRHCNTANNVLQVFSFV
jgi:hypothetical protein